MEYYSHRVLNLGLFLCSFTPLGCEYAGVSGYVVTAVVSLKTQSLERHR